MIELLLNYLKYQKQLSKIKRSYQIHRSKIHHGYMNISSVSEIYSRWRNRDVTPRVASLANQVFLS